MWTLLCFAARLATLTAKLTGGAYSHGGVRGAGSLLRLLLGAYWCFAKTFWRRFLVPRLGDRFAAFCRACYSVKPLGGCTWAMIHRTRR